MYIVHYKSISVNACSIHLKNQVSSKSTVIFSEFKSNWFKSFFYLINMGNGISIMIILKKFGNIELCILQLFIYTFAFVYYSAIVTMQIVCLIKIVEFFSFPVTNTDSQMASPFVERQLYNEYPTLPRLIKVPKY